MKLNIQSLSQFYQDNYYKVDNEYLMNEAKGKK